MNKIILLFFCFLINAHLAQSQIDISAARNMAEGETVTIQGVATNGAELGIIRYLQDDTGGLPVYPGAGSVGNFPDEVSRGDLVQVTGVLKIYNGLLEIDPIESYTVISSNNALPTPQLVSPDGINEENEAKLLTIENVVFDDAGATFSVGNYTFTQNGGGESSEIYVRSGSPLIGMPITQAAVNLTGISSEFNGLYQLLLRDENDIEIVDDFYITEQLSVSDISTDGFTVSWKTNVPASSNVRIGTTPDMTGEITNSNSTTNHSISIEGLAPANFYYLQAFSDNGISTVNSTVKLFSTASQSTGEIRVYFNHPVDNGFSNGSYPSNITPAALEQAIINRINAATTSIDCALYNINRESIVQALSNAHNNGVTVRYISDDQTNNDALSNPTPPFPVLAGNAGDPLMHNKFFIIDADSEDDSWVIMGSTNMTTGNLADDYNNMVFIQDQALAKAYKMEFEEMWGTDGPQPGIFNVRFGEDKSDNTPHLFMVGGHLVESYFSPSDNTSLELVRAVRSADDDLQFALLTFTYNELGTAVLTEHNEGTVVRGIIDNVNDQGTEFSFLQGNGVNVSPDNQSVITHHKYCIVDATNTASDPLVITGSHNWSTGAELRNDENTLIIHHPDVANIFLQEFEARWCEANGGTDCIQVGTEDLEEIVGLELSLFPNPASDFVNISMKSDEAKDLRISLWDMQGRLWEAAFLRVSGSHQELFELNGLPAGEYLLRVEEQGRQMLRVLQVLR